MTNLLRAEWLKLRKSIGFWVLAAIAAGLGFVAFIFFQVYSADISASGIQITGVMAYYQSLQQSQLNLIMVGVLSATFICAEFGNRTFGLALFSGFTRRKFLFAKIAMLLCAVVIITTILPALMLTAFTITDGFGGSLSEFAAPMLRDYGIYALGNVTMAAFFALIACVIRGVGGSIGASIGIAFALDFATIIGFERIQQIMKFSFMTQLNEIGVYSDGVPFCIAVLVGTLAVALVGAAVVFERNELK